MADLEPFDLERAKRLCPPTHRVVPVDLDNAAADAARRATATWINVKGSALTVNREKTKRRWAAALKYYDDRERAETMRRLVFCEEKAED